MCRAMHDQRMTFIDSCSLRLPVQLVSFALALFDFSFTVKETFTITAEMRTSSAFEIKQRWKA